MTTPFTTRSGLQIGIRYMPAPNEIFGDAEKIQTALLCRHTRRSDNLWHWVCNSIYRWL